MDDDCKVLLFAAGRVVCFFWLHSAFVTTTLLESAQLDRMPVLPQAGKLKTHIVSVTIHTAGEDSMSCLKSDQACRDWIQQDK